MAAWCAAASQSRARREIQVQRTLALLTSATKRLIFEAWQHEAREPGRVRTAEARKEVMRRNVAREASSLNSALCTRCLGLWRGSALESRCSRLLEERAREEEQHLAKLSVLALRKAEACRDKAVGVIEKQLATGVALLLGLTFEGWSAALKEARSRAQRKEEIMCQSLHRIALASTATQVACAQAWADIVAAKRLALAAAIRKTAFTFQGSLAACASAWRFVASGSRTQRAAHAERAFAGWRRTTMHTAWLAWCQAVADSRSLRAAEARKMASTMLVERSFAKSLDVEKAQCFRSWVGTVQDARLHKLTEQKLLHVQVRKMTSIAVVQRCIANAGDAEKAMCLRAWVGLAQDARFQRLVQQKLQGKQASRDAIGKGVLRGAEASNCSLCVRCLSIWRGQVWEERYQKMLDERCTAEEDKQHLEASIKLLEDAWSRAVAVLDKRCSVLASQVLVRSLLAWSAVALEGRSERRLATTALQLHTLQDAAADCVALRFAQSAAVVERQMAAEARVCKVLVFSIWRSAICVARGHKVQRAAGLAKVTELLAAGSASLIPDCFQLWVNMLPELKALREASSRCLVLGAMALNRSRVAAAFAGTAREKALLARCSTSWRLAICVEAQAAKDLWLITRCSTVAKISLIRLRLRFLLQTTWLGWLLSWRLKPMPRQGVPATPTTVSLQKHSYSSHGFEVGPPRFFVRPISARIVADPRPSWPERCATPILALEQEEAEYRALYEHTRWETRDRAGRSLAETTPALGWGVWPV